MKNGRQGKRETLHKNVKLCREHMPPSLGTSSVCMRMRVLIAQKLKERYFEVKHGERK